VCVADVTTADEAEPTLVATMLSTIIVRRLPNAQPPGRS
jgi:hypothetical protein